MLSQSSSSFKSLQIINSQKNLVNQPSNANSVFAINQMLLQNRQNYQNSGKPLAANSELQQESLTSQGLRQVELKRDVVIMDYDPLASGKNDQLIHVELSNEAIMGADEDS